MTVLVITLSNPASPVNVTLELHNFDHQATFPARYTWAGRAFTLLLQNSPVVNASIKAHGTKPGANLALGTTARGGYIYPATSGYFNLAIDTASNSLLALPAVRTTGVAAPAVESIVHRC